jgi:hypothetical protein
MFETFSGLRANLADLGYPEIDIYVFPETDGNGHNYNGAYLFHRGTDAQSFMFGSLQRMDEIAEMAYSLAPDYIPEFLASIEE